MEHENEEGVRWEDYNPNQILMSAFDARQLLNKLPDDYPLNSIEELNAI